VGLPVKSVKTVIKNRMDNKPIHQHEEDNDFIDYLLFIEEKEFKKIKKENGKNG